MFSKITEKDEAKKLYKRLSQKLHPDFGGDHELMVLLNAAYEDWQKKDGDEEAFRPFNPFKRSGPIPTEVFEDAEELINIVQEYAKEHPKFSTDFIDSIAEKYDKYGELTEGQYKAVKNIIEKFNMIKPKENT